MNLISHPLLGKANSSHDESLETYVTGSIRSHGDAHSGFEFGDGLVTATLNSGGNSEGFRTEPGEHLVASPITSAYAKSASDDNDGLNNHLVTHALSSEGADASEDGTGRGTPLVAWALHSQNSCAMTGNGEAKAAIEAETARSLDGGAGFTAGQGGNLVQGPVAFESRVARNGRGGPSEIVPPLKAESGQTGKGDGAPLAAGAFGVRRLTPRECEALQGFPPDWTALDAQGKEISDSARYRMLGNAVAVPVAKWIGMRIKEFDR